MLVTRLERFIARLEEYVKGRADALQLAMARPIRRQESNVFARTRTWSTPGQIQ